MTHPHRQSFLAPPPHQRLPCRSPCFVHFFVHRDFSTPFAPTLAICSASWLCSLKFCCTKSPVLFSVVASAFFHHENKVLCTPPIFLLKQCFYLGFPINPLRSHVSVHSQQYRRAFPDWSNNISSGSISLGSFFSSFFFIPSSFSCLQFLSIISSSTVCDLNFRTSTWIVKIKIINHHLIRSRCHPNSFLQNYSVKNTSWLTLISSSLNVRWTWRLSERITKLISKNLSCTEDVFTCHYDSNQFDSRSNASVRQTYYLWKWQILRQDHLFHSWILLSTIRKKYKRENH